MGQHNFNRVKVLAPETDYLALAEDEKTSFCADSSFADAYRTIVTVLDSLDALVYVADMQTHEVLFFNQYGRNAWGDAVGQVCWQVLQSEQQGPCAFCTNHKLIDEKGQPTGVHVWEFQNTVNKHWYQCRDQAIRWVDGRLVRMEIATDITERKLVEEELKAAKEQAEILARTDELTGLNNRRAFFEAGTQAFRHAKRFRHSTSVLMIDLDHFKPVNDNYGHNVGDRLLQSLAQTLKQCTRDVDIIGRLGGEEFAIILPETGLAAATGIAERLRDDIANTAITEKQGEIRCTASLGVASTDDSNEKLESLIARADKALYRAKKSGRNQVANCF